MLIDSKGGVAIDGRADLPEGHATVMDKVVGKAQKVRHLFSLSFSFFVVKSTLQVIGKMTNDPDKHERGELRESGGKAAPQGLARAPHD